MVHFVKYYLAIFYSLKAKCYDCVACNIKHSGEIWENPVSAVWFNANFPGYISTLGLTAFTLHMKKTRVHLDGGHWLSDTGLIWCEKQKNTKFVRLTLQDSAEKCWLKGQSTNFTCSCPVMSSLGSFFMTKIRLIVTQLFWNTCRNIDIVCILTPAAQNIKNTGAENSTDCVITMLCSSGKPWALATCECYLDTKPNLPFKLPLMAMASSSTHTQCKNC